MKFVQKFSVLLLILICIFLVNCFYEQPIPCSECMNLSFKDMTFHKPVTITSAEEVAADETAGTPSYCKVKARIWPEIDVEIKLPGGEVWNKKLLYNGGGGWDGYIPDLTYGLARNYASAASNGGHNSTTGMGPYDGSVFDMSNPANTNVDQKVTDFGYRAAYEGSVLAQKIVKEYYGRKAKYSYWMGCSNGGRGAMMMAQRHPEVFDGYIAGAPHFTYTGTTLRGLWDSQVVAGCMDGSCDDNNALIPTSYYTNNSNNSYIIYASTKLTVLAGYIYGIFDAGDGTIDQVAGDGIIDRPDLAMNSFLPNIDYILPNCAGDIDGATCFTANQRNALKKIYSGMDTTADITIPGLAAGHFSGTALGAETRYPTGASGWLGGIIAPPPGTVPFAPAGMGDILCAPFFQYLDLNLTSQAGSGWNWKTDFSFSTRPSDIAEYGIMNRLDATSGNLRAMKRKGAKMITYHGWGDALVTPLYSIAYYDNVLKPSMGNVDDYYRLFLVPGFGHCSGGVGCGEIDWLTALEEWVENGSEPDSIIGTRAANAAMGWTTDIRRPMCPYPKTAKYKGSGSTDDGDNFYCE